MSGSQAAEEYFVASEISSPTSRNCGHHWMITFKFSSSKPMLTDTENVPPHPPELPLPAPKEQDRHSKSLGTVICRMPPARREGLPTPDSQFSGDGCCWESSEAAVCHGILTGSELCASGPVLSLALTSSKLSRSVLWGRVGQGSEALQ